MCLSISYAIMKIGDIMKVNKKIIVRRIIYILIALIALLICSYIKNAKDLGTYFQGVIIFLFFAYVVLLISVIKAIVGLYKFYIKVGGSARHSILIGPLVLFLIILILAPFGMFSKNDSNPTRHIINLSRGQNSYYIYKSNKKIDVTKITRSEYCLNNSCITEEKYRIKFSKDNMNVLYDFFNATFENSSDIEYKVDYYELNSNQKIIIDSIINNDQSLLKNYNRHYKLIKKWVMLIF